MALNLTLKVKFRAVIIRISKISRVTCSNGSIALMKKNMYKNSVSK